MPLYDHVYVFEATGGSFCGCATTPELRGIPLVWRRFGALTALLRAIPVAWWRGVLAGCCGAYPHGVFAQAPGSGPWGRCFGVALDFAPDLAAFASVLCARIGGVPATIPRDAAGVDRSGQARASHHPCT